MRTGTVTNAGAFANSDACTAASISACACAGTNANASTSAGVRFYTSNIAGAYACTNTGAPVS